MNKAPKFILAVAPKNENVIIEKIVSSLIEDDRPIFYKETYYSLSIHSREKELEIVADTVNGLKGQLTYKDTQIKEANKIIDLLIKVEGTLDLCETQMEAETYREKHPKELKDEQT